MLPENVSGTQVAGNRNMSTRIDIGTSHCPFIVEFGVLMDTVLSSSRLSLFARVLKSAPIQIMELTLMKLDRTSKNFYTLIRMQVFGIKRQARDKLSPFLLFWSILCWKIWCQNPKFVKTCSRRLSRLPVTLAPLLLENTGSPVPMKGPSVGSNCEPDLFVT